MTAPKLAGEKRIALAKPGTYKGTTRGGASLVSRYRYPTAGDESYPGPERVYHVAISGRPANFGVVVLSGRAVPHVVFDGSEDRLAGYTGLPFDLNPYRKSYGERLSVAGVDVPADGGVRHRLRHALRGAGGAVHVPLLGERHEAADTARERQPRAHRRARDRCRLGRRPGVHHRDRGRPQRHARGPASALTVTAAKGRHTIVVHASDYQETKNMENVPPILPNTATLRATVTVR